MMQPTPARPTLVTATAVVSATPASVFSLLVGVAAAGQTIKLHNCATTGAVAAGNEKARIATDAVGAWDFGAFGSFFDVGIVAVVSGGTPVATVTVG